jgi:hypothetical protein
LNDKTHAQTAAPLAAVLGKAMPLWYGMAQALMVGAAFEHRPISNGPGLLIAAASALWAATILFTVTMLVPINKRIVTMNWEAPHTEWLQDRSRWDRLHQIRVVLLFTALLLLLTGMFSAVGARTT